jgi:anti-sigma factor RsiW
MRHVHDQLERWLGGELDEAAAAAVAAHLAECADCRAEAQARRAVWDVLAVAEPAAAAGSVWQAVRARTTARREGWFFGGRPLVQAGFAAAAVACGLLAAVLLPGRADKAALDGSLYAMSSRVLDAEGASAVDLWLGAGADEAEVTR